MISHVQHGRVVDQDQLGFNPYVNGNTLWVLLGAIALASGFALLLDTANATKSTVRVAIPSLACSKTG